MKFVLTLVPPLAGALVAFILNRGNTSRRLRTRALDDLNIAERAKTLLAPSDPITDQIRARAAESLRQYLAGDHRVSRRRVAVKTSLIMGLFGVCWSIGVVAITNGAPRLEMAAGSATGGLLCVGIQTWLERRELRKELGALPTVERSRVPPA